MWSAENYTDTGQRRSHNEDAVFANDAHMLWGVADGMGGHESGDYASGLVVERLTDYQHARLPGVCLSQLHALLADCNAQLIEKARREEADIIGCTVALLSLHGAQAICSWSGDSRIYRLRDRELLCLTRDHSYQAAMEDRDLHRFPEVINGNNQMLTEAIGGEAALHLEHCLYALQQSDRFLICTDGLYKELSDEDIRDTLILEQDAMRAVRQLSTTYHERGARDNVGMVLVQHSCIEMR